MSAQSARRAATYGMLGLATWLVACGDPSGPPRAATVVIDAPATELTVGASVQLTATVRDRDGNVLTDRPVEWSSSDPGVVSVSGSGLVTALAPGGAAVTASADGRSASAQLTVHDSPPEIALSASTLNFTATQGGGPAPPRTVSVENAGALPLTELSAQVVYPAGRPGGWLTAQLSGSTAPATLTVTASPFGLAVGSYTATVRVSSPRAANSPRSIEVGLTVGPASEEEFNLRIDGLYVTQAVQNYEGTVPLVAGRDALLRVFVAANRENTLRPPVRVRLYRNGEQIATHTLPAPVTFVPSSVQEAPLSASWNLPLPAALVQPGLAVLAELDPEGAIDEADRSDNVFPRSGSPLTLDVRRVPPLAIRFVPVHTAATGRTGTVTAQNVEQFLTETRRVFPILEVEAEVREPFTTQEDTLKSDNSNEAWGKVLNELRLLRAAESQTHHYFGVVSTTYASGVAGIGYVGHPVALGWDRLPSASGVAAHELGHNWNRLHAPCGNAGNPDPNFPYAGGTIGVYGFDAARNLLRPPTATDIMGYCNNQWISDYTYVAVMNYRGTSATVASGPAAARPSIALWGRLDGDGPVLEPAFELDAVPTPRPEPGPYTLEGYDAAGNRLFSLPFRPDSVADVDRVTRHFAFVLPRDEVGGDRLASIRLTGPGVDRVNTPAPAAMAAPTALPPQARAQAVLRRVSPRATRLTWDRNVYPMVVVRSARTGAILSFARGGDATVVTPAGETELELVFSDRVHSRAERLPVAP